VEQGQLRLSVKLLGRRCIALDINEKAIELARRNLAFNVLAPQLKLTGDELDSSVYEPELLVGDARNLSFLEVNSVDLICAHPPYANIIHYTDGKEGDLSLLDVDDFLAAMRDVAEESFRVLKPGRQCAILIGDLRRKRHILPLGFELINVYLSAGFKLRELVIKRQHNCKTTGFWYKSSIEHNFLLLAHEYLPIFEKPVDARREYQAQVREVISKPLVLKKVPIISERMKTFQTTTVWVFPEEEFDRSLDSNVLARYGTGGDCLSVMLDSTGRRKGEVKPGRIKGEMGLLYIKSPGWSQWQSGFSVDEYLGKIEEIVNGLVSTMKDNGFVAIQTQDVRINGFIEQLAKRIVDLVDNQQLALKEIIVLVKESQGTLPDFNGYLKLTHQYLIIYEVKRERN